VRINSDDTADGLFTFTEEYCVGHMPRWPIVRGVDLIEMAAQTMGVLATPKLPKGKMPFLVGMGKTRFRAHAFPGQAIRAHVEITHTSSYAVKGKATIFVGDSLTPIVEIDELFGVIGSI
jgi:3-hydroxymyristoyl/3-hydroxydecanoyl-(acyl carrier protein) dehydratase